MVLRVDVVGRQGRWTHDIAFGPGWFAERRTRADGATFAFGEDAAGAWLRVGGAPVRAADAAWKSLARTEAVLWSASFARPGPRDHASFLGRSDAGWELAVRPDGGATLTLLVARQSWLPVELDVADEMHRLVACDGLRWTRRAGTRLLAAMTCRATTGPRTPTSIDRRVLVGAARAPAPAWARVPTRRPPLPVLTRTVELPLPAARRIHVPVGDATGARIPFVLDSGAPWTAMTESTARALGVVPTGDASLFFEPPWLPEHWAWVGVVDRLTVGPVALDGARVLVMREMEDVLDGGGLLGCDVFRRFVVDVDAPAGVLRLHPRGSFALPPGGAWIASVRSSQHVAVPGEIPEIGRGAILLDTGADLHLVVDDPAMKFAHPRTPGSDAWLAARCDDCVTPDYWTSVDGVRVGPLRFPALPAIGRDRDPVSGGIALAGMGLMRHLRTAFDVAARRVWLEPGPSYHALRRTGLELVDDDDAALVTHVSAHSSADAVGVRVGDRITAVDGRPTPGARAAERALARWSGTAPRIAVDRGARGRTIVALAAP